MKKLWLLPALAVAMMVSQAGAQQMCLWNDFGDCWPITDNLANCSQNAWVFNGGTQGEGTFCSGGTFSGTGKTQTPPTTAATVAGCCKWSTETYCFPIGSASDVTNCSQGGNVYWAGASGCPSKTDDGEAYNCPTGTPTYNGQEASCNAYCYWAANPDTGGQAGCFLIVAEDGKTCTDQISSCQQYGGPDRDGNNAYYTNSSCGGQAPVLKVQPNMGLVVATHGRALHISSDRHATVTLYTLAGQKVLSGSVQAGNKVFSLIGQNPGVYYAVVQSGSYTQTLNVILK